MKFHTAHTAALLLNRLRAELARNGDTCTGAVYTGVTEERDGRTYYCFSSLETGLVWMAQGVAGHVYA